MEIALSQGVIFTKVPIIHLVLAVLTIFSGESQSILDIPMDKILFRNLGKEICIHRADEECM